MICPAITREGKPCPISAETTRNGWCHIHDPNGKYQSQLGERHKGKERCKGIVKSGRQCRAKARNNGYCISHGKKHRKTKRRIASGWKKCEYPDCIDVYNPYRKRARRGYKYCLIHYKSIIAKQKEDTRIRKEKQGFSQFVYIFDLGFDDLYKIGKSTDWGKRLVALMGSNPRMRPVAVIGTLSDYNKVEGAMHKRFKDYRKQREIFEFDYEMLEIVVDALLGYGKAIAP